MSPIYERVEWVHDHEDEPSFLYLELDTERRETRKIEVFKDGSSAEVSRDKPESGSTLLSSYLTPSLEEVNANEEFHGREISGRVRRSLEFLWVTILALFTQVRGRRVLGSSLASNSASS